ncbi:hypothetical protein [Burkholderia territorii]|uniref:hypothetical protein n=1 Tax=Burkholderia territorii TaxID=1503055 RepID=UPI0012D9B117|nr:hypothetical protein [Burkholderia territorii]
MKDILRARVRTCNTLKWLCRAPGVGFIGSRRRNDEGPGEKISRPFVQFGAGCRTRTRHLMIANFLLNQKVIENQEKSPVTNINQKHFRFINLA